MNEQIAGSQQSSLVFVGYTASCSTARRWREHLGDILLASAKESGICLPHLQSHGKDGLSSLRTQETPGRDPQAHDRHAAQMDCLS